MSEGHIRLPGSSIGGAMPQPTRSGPAAAARLRLIMITPAVVFVVVMMAAPILFNIWLSFNRWTGGVRQSPDWIGLDNYVRMAADPRFVDALGRTIGFTVATVAIETVLGVAIAVMLHREFRAKGLVRTLLLLPMVATPVAIALVWRLMYEPNLGVLSDLLGALGVTGIDFLADSKSVLWWLIVVDVWEWTPIIILIVAASLAAQPTEMFEASAVDGASAWQTFWRITLPAIRPAIVMAAVFRMIDSIKTFDIIWVMTQGGPGFASETLNIYIYKQTFEAQNLGYAAAMLNVFFMIVVGAALLLLHFRRPS